MKLDRGLQKRILTALAGIYPAGIYEPSELPSLAREDEPSFVANVQYLAEHGLLESGITRRDVVGGPEFDFSYGAPTTITAKGLDFMADDGGLSAILHTVTVRLDANQFAELLASKIEAMPGGDPAEKSEIAKAIRKLPATAIEKMSGKLLDWAVDHAGDALPLLRGILGLAT